MESSTDGSSNPSTHGTSSGLSNPVIGAAQVAQLLGVTLSQVYSYCRAEPPMIPFHRRGNRWLFVRGEIERWAKEGYLPVPRTASGESPSPVQIDRLSARPTSFVVLSGRRGFKVTITVSVDPTDQDMKYW